MNNHYEFITAIEEIYGMQYPKGLLLDIIQEYLAKKSTTELQHLFLQTLKTHPKNFGLPELSVFYRIEKEEDDVNIKIKAEKTWQELFPVSSMHDVLIVDPVAHFVVCCWGDWNSFCNSRDGEYRELTHKDFISRYVNASKAGITDKPRRLAGFLSSEYGHAERFIGVQCRIVGDQATGHRMLSGTKLKPEISDAIKKIYHPVEV